jgi:hypothetical protein
MENWKQALVFGSAGASALCLLRGKKAAGMALAGVSLVMLAAEYPERFAEIRQRIPEYVERGTAFLDVVARVGERVAELSEKGAASWYESLRQA